MNTHNTGTTYILIISIFSIFLVTDAKTSQKKSTRQQTTSAQKQQKQPQTPDSKSTNQTSEKTVQTNPSVTTRTIEVTNNISDKMLSYKHWTGTYRPSKFILWVNNTEIKPHSTKKITITNDAFTVHYSYEFLNGARKGAKKIFFTVEKNITEAHITFNWHNKFHVLIDTATPQKIVKINK